MLVVALALAATTACASTTERIAADSIAVSPPTFTGGPPPPSTSLFFQEAEEPPASPVKQCMDFIVLSASLGDQEFVLRWTAVGEDLDRLRAECERVQAEEPLMFADWVARWALAKAFLEGGVPPTLPSDTTTTDAATAGATTGTSVAAPPP